MPLVDLTHVKATDVIATDTRTVQAHLDDLEQGANIPAVRNLYDYFPNNTMPAGDVSSYLQSAVSDAVGGLLRVPDGQYNISTGATIDFSAASIPPVGRQSQRFNLGGDTQANTTFNTNNNTFLSYTGDLQGDGQGVFSSMKFSDFCVFGTNNTGVALRLKSAVGVLAENIQFRRNNYGLFLSGILTSTFNGVYADYNNTGMYVETATNSQINNVNYNGCRFNSNNQHGVIGVFGTRVAFKGCSWESNGWGTNDVGGDSNTGAAYISVSVPFATVDFDSCYFEANEGLADITIVNTTPSPIIVNMRSTVFTRGNVRGRGSLNILNFLSPGGGPILLNLYGCTFVDNTGTGFVSTPSWVGKPFLKQSGIDTCMFGSAAMLPTETMASSGSTPVCISSTGAILAGPGYLSCTKTSTGVYSVTSTYTLGSGLDGFTVLTAPRVTGFRVDVTKNSPINLTVRVRDSAGTLTDAAFDLAIITGLGEGR